MTVGVHETEMLVTGVTVSVADPAFVLSWTEMAVIVTVVEAVTGCAVKTPLASIVPALVPQLTRVLKVPVPLTVAVHELVWPDWREVGVQETETPVMVEVVLPPPPPQAMMPSSAETASSKARERKPSPRRPIGG